MFDRIRNVLMFGSNVANITIRERLFRLLINIGGTAAIIATLESLAVGTELTCEIPMIIFCTVIVISVVLTYIFKKTNLAAVLTGLTLILVVLPFMFFESGGIEGGITIWFPIGYVYVFLLFEGRSLLLFTVLNILMNSAVYHFSYSAPELVKPLASNLAVHMDSLFSMIVAGLLVGLLIRLQVYMYEKQAAMVKEQAEELGEASKAQNAFFANMSHEIRTPINSIIGLNEMILRKSEDSEITEFATDIKTSSKLLLDLVNDILDVSKLKQNKMEIVDVEYHSENLIRDVVEMLSVRMVEKNLEFIVNVDENLPAVMQGDGRHIQQVLINLLTNSVKYTNEGRVYFGIEAERIGQDHVKLTIEVKDTGIGIRKEQLDSLYDTFHRVDLEKNANVEGSGLGLSITKQLVDLMGGEIMVDSIYTKGTTFTITLMQTIVNDRPIGKVNFLARKKHTGNVYYEHTFEAPEARILLVEDNEMNSLVVTQLLKETKVKIDVARSGAECLSMTKKKMYDVILMDYMMPDMNGVDTLKLVRKQENGLCTDTSVILLTANSASDATRMSEAFGFDSSLEKPIQADKLEREVLRFIPDELVEFRRELVEMEDEEEPQIRSRRKRLLITTDCVCDLPEKIISKYDIRVMYLYIKIGKARFADTQEIDSDSMVQFFNNDDLEIKADSVSAEEFEDFFASALAEAEHVLHISMAAYSGKTYNAAVTAARGFDHVTVIDSGQVSSGQGLLVMHAAQMLYAGYGMESIIAEIERMKHRVVNHFILPDSKSFYRSGYIGPATSRVMELLNAHPVVAEKKSYMKVQTILFGDLEKVWKRHLIYMLRNRRNIDPEIIFVAYVGMTHQQQETLRKIINQNFEFTQVVFHKASFSSSCNSGYNTVGIAFLRKSTDMLT